MYVQGSAVIRYLEFCIEKLKNKDKAIHNYLLSLYAVLKPEKLLDYLNFQGTVSSGINALCETMFVSCAF